VDAQPQADDARGDAVPELRQAAAQWPSAAYGDDLERRQHGRQRHEEAYENRQTDPPVHALRSFPPAGTAQKSCSDLSYPALTSYPDDAATSG
jgi:hypothetical protein